MLGGKTVIHGAFLWIGSFCCPDSARGSWNVIQLEKITSVAPSPQANSSSSSSSIGITGSCHGAADMATLPLLIRPHDAACVASHCHCIMIFCITWQGSSASSAQPTSEWPCKASSCQRACALQQPQNCDGLSAHKARPHPSCLPSWLLSIVMVNFIKAPNVE